MLLVVPVNSACSKPLGILQDQFDVCGLLYASQSAGGGRCTWEIQHALLADHRNIAVSHAQQFRMGEVALLMFATHS